MRHSFIVDHELMKGIEGRLVVEEQMVSNETHFDTGLTYLHCSVERLSDVIPHIRLNWIDDVNFSLNPTLDEN